MSTSRSSAHGARDGAPSTRTVDRALDLLEAVIESAGGATLSELGRATDLPPATASRLLGTLANRGLVRRDGLGAYRPGHRMMRIATLVLRGEPLYDLAGPHLVEMARCTGETANICIPVDGDRALYLRQEAGDQRVQTKSWTGRTIPRRGSANGAALAGKVSADGYAVARRTVEPDITAVAAPIRDHRGEIIGALSVIAPTYRTSEQDIRFYGRVLVQHAQELSLALGAPERDAEVRIQ